MTEKRFKQVGVCFIDKFDTKISYCCANEIDCKNIVGKMNELSDENEQLKNVVGYNYVEHKRCVDNYVDKIKEIEKENEQLKDKYNEQSVEYEGLEEQVENLLDFKDKVFNLINKKLKEADKGFEQTYDGWYQGQVDILKELEKELQMK